MYRLVLFAFCLMIIFCCACAPSGKTALEATSSTPTASPTSTPSATPEPTITASRSIAPTATASPKPTVKQVDSTPMIVKGKEKVKADVNQRFQDFLYATGEFTDRKIAEYTFKSDISEKTDLGCFTCDNKYKSFYIQGVVLYYQSTNLGELFALGTKDRNGNRIITLVEFPSNSILSTNNKIRIAVHSNNTYFSESETDDDIEIMELSKKDEVYFNFLNECMNKPICFNIRTCLGSEISWYHEIPENEKNMYIEGSDLKVEANRSLISRIYFVFTLDTWFFNSVKEANAYFYSADRSILTVQNYDEFENLVNTSYDQIPSFIYGFSVIK